MKKIRYLLLFFSLTCSKQEKLNSIKNDIVSDSHYLKDTSENRIVYDEKILERKKLKTIFPDYFQLSESSFNDFKADNSKWFIDINGTHKLYFIPYTDYSITTAILTSEKIKDSQLIDLLQSEGIKIKDQSKSIKLTDIKSKKGISLGMSINDVKAVFNNPTFQNQTNDTTNLEWKFTMLEGDLNIKNGNLTPFILEGLEFSIDMKFLKDKLIKVVYKYQVP